MKTLVIIDIDGVLIDHTGRNHLIPEDMRLNSNWIAHQAAIHADEPIIDEIDCQVGNVIAHAPGRVTSVYLTSRLELARSATIKQLQRTATYNVAPLTTSLLEMRSMNDHREPARFKADMVTALVDAYRPDNVIIIEDTMDNIKAMSHALKQFVTPSLTAYHAAGDMLNRLPVVPPVVDEQAPIARHLAADIKRVLLEALDDDHPQDLIKTLITETLDNYQAKLVAPGMYFRDVIKVDNQLWDAEKIRNKLIARDTLLMKHGICEDCGDMFNHWISEPFASCACKQAEWPESAKTPYMKLEKMLAERSRLVELPTVHQDPYADDYTKAVNDGRASMLEEIAELLIKANVPTKGGKS